jgi:transcription antitermination factor NusG
MPYIISVVSGKEKVVQAILAGLVLPLSLRDLLSMELAEHTRHARGFNCSIPPSLCGFLVCNEFLPPQIIQNVPHVLGLTEATAEQAKEMMTVTKEQTIFEGMRVQALRGDYEGFCGIVREIEGGEATVDFSVYGKMVAVRIQKDDLEQA